MVVPKEIKEIKHYFETFRRRIMREIRVISSRRRLPDGVYLVHPPVNYVCQFADRERVSEFLDNSAALILDDHWQEFGFGNVEEYQFWAPRLCGIACLKMALDAVAANQDSMAKLTAKGVESGGYLVHGADGSFIDKGWFYKPLVLIARDRGLEAEIFTQESLTDIAFRVLRNQIVVASVNPRIIRGDEPPTPNASRGGHLVIVHGVEIRDAKPHLFYIKNPSGRTWATQEGEISSEVFEGAFAGRGFYIAANDVLGSK